MKVTVLSGSISVGENYRMSGMIQDIHYVSQIKKGCCQLRRRRHILGKLHFFTPLFFFHTLWPKHAQLRPIHLN